MVGLPERDGSLTTTALQPALEAIGRADAVVLGPGIGKEQGAQELARELVERIDVPLVIDADGLNALAGGAMEELVRVRPWPTVMTPHAGELGRMLGVDSKEIGEHRLRYAREAAAKSKAIIVLKGDDTLVATPNGRVAVSRGHAPALATAGTGDVLSGVIGAMLAKGLAPPHAACAGVYAHLRAGQIAAAPDGPDGVIAVRRDPRAARSPRQLAVALRALARVDLGAIERNARRLATIAGPADLCAVVKADGYGHGMVQAARAAQAGGASWLAVATAEEARGLREGGLEGPVLVMGALSPEELEVAVAARADVVAWREAFVAALPERSGDEASGRGRGVAVHVKLDSGMGRLGTRDAEEATRVAEAVAARDGLRLAGAMTHFATADDDPGFMAEQLAVFTPWAQALKAAHPEILVHAANSAATLREPAARFDLVRCGIALYGMDPFQEDPAAHELEPALSLVSYVAEVKVAEPGQSAGYGRQFVAGARPASGRSRSATATASAAA